MKRTGTFIMIAGAAIVIAALFIFPAKDPINAVDSEFPKVPITGTGYFPWKVFAGMILMAIGSVFRFADAIDQKAPTH